MPVTKQSFGGSWTTEKLNRLRKYLAAYVQIMKEQSSWCEAYCYIDAFAGTGYNTPKAVASNDESTVDLLPDIAAERGGVGGDEELSSPSCTPWPEK